MGTERKDSSGAETSADFLCDVDSMNSEKLIQDLLFNFAKAAFATGGWQYNSAVGTAVYHRNQ